MGVIRFCGRCHQETPDVDTDCPRCTAKEAAFVEWWRDFWEWTPDGGRGPGWFWLAILAVAWLYIGYYPR